MLENAPPLQNLFASFGNEKSRIDYRILKESGNDYSRFLYNGLFYKFFPEVNMFVNQHGYGMPYEKALSLAISMGFTEKDLKNTNASQGS